MAQWDEVTSPLYPFQENSPVCWSVEHPQDSRQLSQYVADRGGSSEQHFLAPSYGGMQPQQWHQFVSDPHTASMLARGVLTWEHHAALQPTAASLVDPFLPPWNHLTAPRPFLHHHSERYAPPQPCSFGSPLSFDPRSSDFHHDPRRQQFPSIRSVPHWTGAVDHAGEREMGEMGARHLLQENKQRLGDSDLGYEGEQPEGQTTTQPTKAARNKSKRNWRASSAAVVDGSQSTPVLPTRKRRKQSPFTLGPERSLINVPGLDSFRSDELSPLLQDRVAAEDEGFLDRLGFGTWTQRLNPNDPKERSLIIELLDRLYNRPADGRYVKEVFGPRHGKNKEKMCGAYFSQLLLMAEYKVAAYSVQRKDAPELVDTCFDTAAVYNKIPGYFDRETRASLFFNGTGGGRKIKTGSRFDFTEGEHYFKSRIRAVKILTRWEESKKGSSGSSNDHNQQRAKPVPLTARSPSHEEENGNFCSH